MRTRLLIALLTLCISLPFAAHAGKGGDPLAELQRLEDEIERLTQRNAWPGVERTYGKMTELDTVTIGPKHHIMGAQSAIHNGDMRAAHERLAQAVPEGFDPSTPDADPVAKEALLTLRGMELRYGNVTLLVAHGRIPALVRPQMPFTREERMSIEFGREYLAKNSEFRGFLPVGRYMVDGQFFEVVPGVDVQEIEVGQYEKMK
jgi:hypothetical protein